MFLILEGELCKVSKLAESTQLKTNLQDRCWEEQIQDTKLQLQSYLGSTNLALLIVCDLMILHSQLLGSLESFPVDEMKLYSLLGIASCIVGFYGEILVWTFFQNFSNSAAKSKRGNLPNIYVTVLFICLKLLNTEVYGKDSPVLLTISIFSLAKWCFLLMLRYSNQKHLIHPIKNSLLGFADQMNTISKTFQVGNFLQILIFVDLKLKL